MDIAQWKRWKLQVTVTEIRLIIMFVHVSASSSVVLFPCLQVHVSLLFIIIVNEDVNLKVICVYIPF